MINIPFSPEAKNTHRFMLDAAEVSKQSIRVSHEAGLIFYRRRNAHRKARNRDLNLYNQIEKDIAYQCGKGSVYPIVYFAYNDTSLTKTLTYWTYVGAKGDQIRWNTKSAAEQAARKQFPAGGKSSYEQFNVELAALVKKYNVSM